MRHLTEMKVRFGDTDMLGHVNNASYFTYMEESRIDFLAALGLEQVPLILASARVDFLAQTYFSDLLDVETFVSRIGNSSFDIVNRMYRSGGQDLVFEGVAVVVYFDYATQRAALVPDDLRTQLQVYLEEHLPSRS